MIQAVWHRFRRRRGNQVKDKIMTRKKRRIICAVSILAAAIMTFVLFGNNITNAVIRNTMGRDLPLLSGEPEVGKWYTLDVDDSVSSDGSRWQGYFRKGSENKVLLYFYGGGFSVNDYTAARSMDVDGGFYNPRLGTGLNVMTYAIRKWGIGNSADNNMFKNWTFIGVPYCNGDFHAGTGEKEYTALQSVQVQCGMLRLRHMCIFPYDGTDRIRFTGQGHKARSQPDASGPPKIDLLCGFRHYSPDRAGCQDGRHTKKRLIPEWASGGGPGTEPEPFCTGPAG